MTGPWIVLVVTQWILIVLLGLIQIGILKKVLPILERTATSKGTPFMPLAGTMLPDFAAILADGTAISRVQLFGKPFVLLFVSVTCEPCHRLLTDLQSSDFMTTDAPVYAVADPQEHLADLPLPGGVTLLLQPGRCISRALQINTTPLAMAIDDAGKVVESLVPAHSADIQRLVAAAMARPRSLARSFSGAPRRPPVHTGNGGPHEE